MAGKSEHLKQYGDYQFSIHDRDPTVVHLAVHLENGQRIYFSTENIQQIVKNPPKTTFSACFDLRNSDTFAKTLFYHEMPYYCTWANNKFSRRKWGQDVVGHPGIKKDAALGRVFSVHPSQSECFDLRILPSSRTWSNIVPGIKKHGLNHERNGLPVAKW